MRKLGRHPDVAGDDLREDPAHVCVQDGQGCTELEPVDSGGTVHLGHSTALGEKLADEYGLAVIAVGGHCRRAARQVMKEGTAAAKRILPATPLEPK